MSCMKRGLFALSLGIIFSGTNVCSSEILNCPQSVDAHRLMQASGYTALVSTYVWIGCTCKIWWIESQSDVPSYGVEDWERKKRARTAPYEYARSVAKTAGISAATCCLISALATKIS